MVYENVKRLADEMGISIAAIERECGLGNATIKGWQLSSPSAKNLKKVAEFLGKSMEDLMTDPDPEEKEARA